MLNLTIMGYTLCLHWEWLQRAQSDCIWIALPSKQEMVSHGMFNASVMVQVGNGLQARFWSDQWLQGASIESVMPQLVSMVLKRIRKNRSVAQALQCDQWIPDLSGSLSMEVLCQFIWVWEQV
jgi:hypothetical protein